MRKEVFSQPDVITLARLQNFVTDYFPLKRNCRNVNVNLPQIRNLAKWYVELNLGSVLYKIQFFVKNNKKNL
jgi:hypothetical protein